MIFPQTGEMLQEGKQGQLYVYVYIYIYNIYIYMTSYHRINEHVLNPQLRNGVADTSQLGWLS